MSIIKFPGFDTKVNGEPPSSVPPENDGELVFICKCGCTSFILYESGVTECCNCETVSSDADRGDWRLRLPPKPAEPEGMPDTVKITHIGTSKGALQRVLDHGKSDNTAFVIIGTKDGNVRTWGNDLVSAGETVWWLDEMLAMARKNLLKDSLPPSDLDGFRALITTSKEIHSIALIQQDGSVSVFVSAYSPVETDAEKEWLDRKLDTVKDLIINDPPKPAPPEDTP